MAFNGSGTFVRLYSWTSDRDAAIKILASRMDGEMDGFATGLSTCITKDGQTTVTANIPFNGNRLTGVGDPSSAQDAATKAYVDALSYIANLVEDVTPQLGGALDVNGFSITSATNGNVTIDPDGTGSIVIGATLITASNESITLDPNGTGTIVLGAATVTVEDDITHAGDTDNKITFGTDTQTFTLGGNPILSLDATGVSVNSTQINDLAAPVASTDAATKGYVDSAAGAFGNEFLHVQDQKTAGTDGGTFTSGAWRTRTLNTEVTNSISGASLATNAITLPAGTYFIIATVPGHKVDLHKAKLYDTTGAADLIIGTAERAPSGTAFSTQSRITGQFTLADTSALEIQHRCSATEATDGFGLASGFSVVEIYADALIWKVA